MVKLYALTVLYKSPTSATTLKAAYDVESFSFFQRNSIKEFMCFVSKTIVERTQTCARQSVKEGGNHDKNKYFISLQAQCCYIVYYDIAQSTCAMYTCAPTILPQYSSRITNIPGE